MTYTFFYEEFYMFRFQGQQMVIMMFTKSLTGLLAVRVLEKAYNFKSLVNI